MIAQKNDTYIKACLQAWLFCESSIHQELQSVKPAEELVKSCHQCAQACFAVVSRLVSQAAEIQELALHCLLSCRECENLCRRFADPELDYCADVCSRAAEKMGDLLTGPSTWN